MASLTTILRALGELGPEPTLLYGLYQVLLRLGWFRWRTPRRTWADVPLASWLRPDISSEPEQYLQFRARIGMRFFLHPDDEFAGALNQVIGHNRAAAIAQADAILGGEFRLFGTDGYDLGFPPDWGRFCSTGEDSAGVSIPLDRHWTAYDESNFAHDVKLLWEPARFGWVFPLIRAYYLTEDTRYPEAVWTLIDSWRNCDSPNAGPHWSSAQEVAIRLLAVIFALHATFERFAQAPRELCAIAGLIAEHAARIPPTLMYARAQRNNHLLVEAAALYSTGLLFPEFRKAKAWKRLGRRWLERSLTQQIFPDGGYVQHSTNYHRLALQAALWAVRLAGVNDEPFPSDSLDALRNAALWLASMIDGESGHVPNVGPNDGALIFPLSTCAFEDHRPTCQAASFALMQRKPFPDGPWNEELLWFGLPSGVSQDNSRRKNEVRSKKVLRPIGLENHFPDSGFSILRGENSWGTLRCARFRSRPGHSDQLHLDLWWHGHNLACDPGTYLYNGKPPWDNPWIGAAFHNTIVVDGREPMRRAGRFLWVDWAQGEFVGRWKTQDGAIEVVVGQHHGYRRIGIVHRRTVARLGDAGWLIVDDLIGSGDHRVSIGWTMPDFSWRLNAEGISLDLEESGVEVSMEGQNGDVGLYRAGALIAGNGIYDHSELHGWRATKYAVRQPALRLVKRFVASAPLRHCTWWAFDAASRDGMEIFWNEPDRETLPFSSVGWQGKRLELNDAHPIDSSSLRRAG
jgi:hypothetical protein